MQTSHAIGYNGGSGLGYIGRMWELAFVQCFCLNCSCLGRKANYNVARNPRPNSTTSAVAILVPFLLLKLVPVLHMFVCLCVAVEPIVEKPREPEQSEFACADGDCNKKFRKESNLQVRPIASTAALSICRTAVVIVLSI